MTNVYEPRQRRFQQHAPQPSRLLGLFSVVNLVLVLAIGAGLIFWSEDWWLTTILVYTPKAPLAIPAGLLTIVSLATRPRWLIVNVTSLLLVFGPIMGYVAPIARLSDALSGPAAATIRVVSCNIQTFQPDFPKVVAELARQRPDIVAFQEVRGEDHPLLAEFFQDWHVARDDAYWVGSKYPVRILGPLLGPSFDRVTGLLVEVELPTGKVCLANVHFMTARRSLSELTPRSVLMGQAEEVIAPHQVLRDQEMMDVRTQIEDLRGGMPLIVLGDFNTPTSSSLFRRWWNDMSSAFDTAGSGFGYTSPCRKNHRYWFNDTPWVRIDHILYSPDWRATSCEIGTSDGSDHRLIAAALDLTGAGNEPPAGLPRSAHEGFSNKSQPTE